MNIRKGDWVIVRLGCSDAVQGRVVRFERTTYGGLEWWSCVVRTGRRRDAIVRVGDVRVIRSGL